MSADHVKAAKPEKPLYQLAQQRVGCPIEECVFAAAHAWYAALSLDQFLCSPEISNRDTLAARKAGFVKTAYCLLYEKYPVRLSFPIEEQHLC